MPRRGGEEGLRSESGPPGEAMRKAAFVLALLLCAALTGCGDSLLERSYSSTVPHSAAYWENEDADTLRAENYQELVNALLILLEEHNEDGVVRIYGEHSNFSAMAGRACVEVQQETALGAYLLDYITYNGSVENGSYQLTVHFGYRRSAEEQNAIVNATSTVALPDLLRSAVEEGRESLAIRVGYFATDRDGVLELVTQVRDEFFPREVPAPEPDENDEADAPAGEAPAAEEPGTDPADSGETAEAFAGEPAEQEQAETEPSGETETGTEQEPPGEEHPEGDAEAEPEKPAFDTSPWQVVFYPDTDQPGIVEVILLDASRVQKA